MKHSDQFVDIKKLREFAATVGALIALIFGLALPYLFHETWPLWPWIVSSIFLVWGLVHPSSLFLPFQGWMTFGKVMGWINTRIILGIMFYLIFFPFGLVMKLMGKDPMSRSFTSQDSYRIKSVENSREHFERPF